MNKLLLSVLVAACCLAVVSSFAVLPPSAGLQVRAAAQAAPKVAPRNVMMVDMTGGALADVSPIGSIIMLVLVVSLWEITGRGEKA